ncbi:MAG: DUF2905 domain-containing protein [Gammaproteobacteria bacterium]|jgi:hypothetical protein
MQKGLIIVGIAIVLLGLAWPWLGNLPFGRLPGDIVVRRENFTFYLPITSMIVFSLVLSVLVWILRR